MALQRRPRKSLSTQARTIAANAPLLPVLDAGALGAEALAAIRQILVEGESANTRRTYASAWRYWSGWHQLRFGAPLALPLPASSVVQFVIDHAARGLEGELSWELPAAVDDALLAAGLKKRPGVLKLTTIVQRVAILSSMHRLRRLDNPCEDPAVRHVLAMVRRGHAKRGERPTKKTALVAEHLQALLATCDDSLLGRRDRALLAFAWSSGGRRRSEVSAARLDNLTRLPDGSYLYRLGPSKTDQTGDRKDDPDKPIVGTAAEALAAWLAASGLTEGALFRRIRGSVVAEALRPEAVAEIVKKRCALAGIEGDFAGHSLRSGFATEAGRQEIPLPDVMALTGHTQVQSVIGYWRSGVGVTHRVARLLDRVPPKSS